MLAAQRVKANDNRPLMVFFEDEASFGRINHVRKCWVHRPDRAVVKKQAIREYLYAFTAVCPQTGETCSIISPFCNTEAMNALLTETSLAFPHLSNRYDNGFSWLAHNKQIKTTRKYNDITFTSILA